MEPKGSSRSSKELRVKPYPKSFDPVRNILSFMYTKIFREISSHEVFQTEIVHIFLFRPCQTI